jgi:hypothetical protein
MKTVKSKETLPMSDTPGAPQKVQTDEHKETYYSFQIKGWTNFDPMGQTLSKIAGNIEQGNGFLTLVEIVKTENDLAVIGDEEVKECFANVLAAKRLVRTVNELPKNLIEELRSALKTEEAEAAPRKPVTSTGKVPGNGESAPRAGQWP